MRCGNCGSGMGYYLVPGGSACQNCAEFVPSLPKQDNAGGRS